jgi:hypothetical protein
MSIARAPATAQPSPSGATGRGRVLCRSYGAWIGHRGRAVYRHGAPTELWAGSWVVCRFKGNVGAFHEPAVARRAAENSYRWVTRRHRLESRQGRKNHPQSTHLCRPWRDSGWNPLFSPLSPVDPVLFVPRSLPFVKSLFFLLFRASMREVVYQMN